MQFTREDILFPFTFHVFWVCYTKAATLRMKCERINTMKTKYEQYSWGGDSEFGLRGSCLLTPAWLFWRSWGLWNYCSRSDGACSFSLCWEDHENIWKSLKAKATSKLVGFPYWHQISWLLFGDPNFGVLSGAGEENLHASFYSKHGT